MEKTEVKQQQNEHKSFQKSHMISRKTITNLLSEGFLWCHILSFL